MISRIEWITPIAALAVFWGFMFLFQRARAWKTDTSLQGAGWIVAGAVAYVPLLCLYVLVALIRANQYPSMLWVADLIVTLLVPATLFFLGSQRSCRWLYFSLAIVQLLLALLLLFARTCIEE